MPSKWSPRKNRIGISTSPSSSTKLEYIGEALQKGPASPWNHISQKSEHRAVTTTSRKTKGPPIKSKPEDGSREGPAPAEPKLVMVVLRPFGLRILRYNPVPVVNVSVQHLRKFALKKSSKEETTQEKTPRVRIKKPTDNRLENSNNEALKEWLRKKTALLSRERETQKKQKKLEKRKEKEMEREKQLRNEESERMVRKWMERKRQEQKLNRMKSSKGIPDKPTKVYVPPPAGKVISTRGSPVSAVSYSVQADVNSSIPGRKMPGPADSAEPQKPEPDAQEAGGICGATMKPTKTWLALSGSAPAGNSDLCGA